MKPALADRLCRFLVGCYPPRWKQRYAQELLDVLDQHRGLSASTRQLPHPLDHRCRQPQLP